MSFTRCALSSASPRNAPKNERRSDQSSEGDSGKDPKAKALNRSENTIKVMWIANRIGASTRWWGAVATGAPAKCSGYADPEVKSS